MRERSIANLFLIFSVIFFPWWVFLLATIIFIFFFDNFFEAFILAVVMEMYHGPILAIGDLSKYLLFPLLVLALVLILGKFKKHILFTS